MKYSVLLLSALSILLFTGCRTVAVVPVGTHTTVSHNHHVHPPHAPAHGYRHHYHGHDLIYDTDYDAYAVLGYDGVFFIDNFYLRFYAGDWQITTRIGEGWHRAEDHHVPRKLRRHKRYNRHHRHTPHAPAHGHRHSHYDGVDLVFDSSIGVYVALGFNDLFFFDNHYMRYYDGYWHYADRYDGGWLRAKDRHIPQKLREARRKHKKDFFKRVRHNYRHEHRKYRENREYRKKHRDRWNRSDRRHDDDHKKYGKPNNKGKNKYRDHDNGKKYKKKDYDKDGYKKDRNRDRDRHKSEDRDRDRDRDRDNDRDRNKRDGGWLR